MKNALGLIETIGLAAAIEAADTAVKSANVRLIGYELTKGDGMVTVKIEGDVGAVKAAVESAKAAASRVSGVYSVQVIPRPAVGLDNLVFSKETVGLEQQKPVVEKEEKPEVSEEVKAEETEVKEEISEPEKKEEAKPAEPKAEPKKASPRKSAPKKAPAKQDEK